MTLTTEQLRALAKFWREKVADDMAGTVILEKDILIFTEVLEELLANREAQPVAWRYRYRRGPHKGTWIYVANESECATRPFHEKQALYTAPPALAASQPAAAVFPESLPCPVHLLPGLKFGKGVPTRSMLDALVRRAEYEAELEAMTPEQNAEDDARIEAFKALLPQPPAQVVPDGFKLVPTVPTPEMIAAAMNCDDVIFHADESFCVNFGTIYAAMLATAPGQRE
ncbi:hypothetical protein MX040_00370 [Serratia marcescens]|uniref:hypothetical protein n=1 Tax=Serratia marcescens TaxID=615 RepID=UPI001FF59F0D|nr:hypothetical protein [Serratia marcescens]MCK1117838.1 hypothetical protein [Serratia marcescens]